VVSIYKPRQKLWHQGEDDRDLNKKEIEDE
jgi:hypothetical protein